MVILHSTNPNPNNKLQLPGNLNVTNSLNATDFVALTATILGIW